MMHIVPEDLLEEAVRLLDQGLGKEDPPVAFYSSAGERSWPREANAQFPDSLPELAAVASRTATKSPPRVVLRPKDKQSAFVDITTELGLTGYLVSQPVAPEEIPEKAAQLRTQGKFLDIALQARCAAIDLTVELSDRYEELNLVYDLSNALRLDENGNGDLRALFESVYETLQIDGICLIAPSINRVYHIPDEIDLTALEAMLPVLRRNIEETGMSCVINNLFSKADLAPSAARHSTSSPATSTSMGSWEPFWSIARIPSSNSSWAMCACWNRSRARSPSS